MKCKGYLWSVQCPDTGAVATVISKPSTDQLIMEFSSPKFQTGQNLIGIENLLVASQKGIAKTCRLMDIDATPNEFQKIKDGQFKLTKVDYAAHVDCRTQEGAVAFMIAAGQRAMAVHKERSFYGDETLYIGQHNRRKTLKMYQKGLEMLVHPIAANVYARELLIEESKGLVRLELTLRNNELSDHGLDDPRNWTPDVAHQLMLDWVARFLPLNGRVPNVDRIDELKPNLQLKLRAWLAGDSLAFSRKLSKETYKNSRTEVLKVTGIDIANQLSPELQRDSFLTMSELFQAGFGFKDHAGVWQKFVDAVKNSGN